MLKVPDITHDMGPNIVTLFPLCVYQVQLDPKYSDIIKPFVNNFNSSKSITSDVLNDSEYHLKNDLKPFFQDVMEHVKNYTRIIGYDTDLFDFYIVKSWVNNFANNPSGSICKHKHPTSDISIAYYPEETQSPVCFENTHRPNEIHAGSYTSNIVMKHMNEFSFDHAKFFPKKSCLLIFPSKTIHWVERLPGDMNRCSLSADIITCVKEGGPTFELMRNPLSTYAKF